jgi:hypothetical protein
MTALSVLAPQRCAAEDDAPSILGYAFEGMGTGVATGLAVGYLATGSEFESKEWRTLVWGTAIGALAGLGTGLVLGFVDAGMGKQRGVGFYMVRDSNYGWMVGAIAGGIIGGLIWLGDGTGKDLLRGFAWGTVIGAGSGLLIGAIEGALRGSGSSESRSAQRRNLQLGFGIIPGGSGAPVPYPTLSGRF